MSSVWTIRRSTSDIKLAGLCGGIARQWDIDPVLVRVGFAVLALSGGIGIVLYLAGWLLLPADGRDTAPVDDLFGAATRKWPREVWIAIVTMACVAAFALFGWLTPFGIGPALVIAVIWYFGFYRPRAAQRDDSRAGPPAPSAVPAAASPPPPFRYPGPPSPFTEAAEAWQRRIAEYESLQASPSGPPDRLWPAPPDGNLAAATTAAPPAPVGLTAPVTAADAERYERAAFLATADPVGLYSEPVATSTAGSVIQARRRPSARRLGWAALLVLGLTLAGLGLADYLGAAITPTVYATAALLVVGLALVLATWLGRPRGLLPLGVVLAVGVLGLSASGPGLPGIPPSVIPDTHVVYSTPAELPAGGDHLDAGTLIVDLSRVPIRTDMAYKARVDIGTVDVLVPKDAQVVVRYSLEAGEVTAFTRPVASGTELRGLVTDPQPLRPDRPTLTLDLAVDLGTVQVRR